MIWAVRHAPVAVEGICYGQSDMPLSVDHDEAASLILARLNEQVDANGGRLAPTCVYSSPWDRTAGVATRLAMALGLPLEIDVRLSELSFGLWEGRAFARLEVEDGPRFNRWMFGYLSERPPGGESLDELRIRVNGFLDEPRTYTEVPLLVTHAGVIRALRARSSGRSYEVEMRDRVEHLRPEHLPMKAEDPHPRREPS